MSFSLETFDSVAFGAVWHSFSADEKREYVSNLTPEEAHFVASLWEVRARPEQLAPPGDWRFWLALAGRGWGKSLAITQWGHKQAMRYPGSIGAMVASTAADVRDVLVGGPSGILTQVPERERPHYSPTYRRLDWANGSSAILFSADEPERFRGPQYHWAICDEFASWRRPESFTQMLLGLRLSNTPGQSWTSDPRCAIATTPKPVKHLRDLIARKGVKKTGGTTYDNRDNLAPAWFEEIITQYEGSSLGKQELLGVLLDDLGSLWSEELIQRHRVIFPDVVPEMERVLIAVDPAVTSNEESSETGIIVGGTARINRIKHCYILDDLSCKASPETWGNIVVNAYHETMADAVVVEVNNGGDLVRANIHAIDPTVNIIEVRASKGKVSRAEPVVTFYEQGKVHHDGVFANLEKQQTEWTVGAKSPDRLDALVWCVTALMSNDDQAAPMRQVRTRFNRQLTW